MLLKVHWIKQDINSVLHCDLDVQKFPELFVNLIHRDFHTQVLPQLLSDFLFQGLSLRVSTSDQKFD